MADDDTKPATGSDGGTQELGDAGKRAIQAERERARKAEAEAKAARDELAKVKADQDASKSEIQKVLEKLATMEERARKAETDAMRAEVAQVKGLTPAQARRLHGVTRAELEADADELLEAFGGRKPGEQSQQSGQGEQGAKSGEQGAKSGTQQTGPKSRPAELREGTGATSAGTSDEDMSKIADQVLGRL